MYFHLTLLHKIGRSSLNFGPILKSKSVSETREQAAEVYQLYSHVLEFFQCKNCDGVWALISRNSCKIALINPPYADVQSVTDMGVAALR